MKRQINQANLQLETLEDRQVLSTAAWVQDNTLFIQGDEYSNNVSVTVGYDMFVVQAEDGYYEAFFLGEDPAIVANLGGGADKFQLDSDYGTWVGQRLGLDVDAGAGDDNVEIFGNSGFLSQRDDLAVTIRTQAGADHVEVYLRKMQDSAVNLDIDMGTDHDTFTGSLEGDMLNSSVDLKVRAGFGANRLNFAADMDLSDYGTDLLIDHASRLDVQLLAQRGRDSVDMRLDAKVSGAVALWGHGGEGADILNADITRGTHDSGDLAVDLLGAKGDDTLTLNYQKRLMLSVPIGDLTILDLDLGLFMAPPAASYGFAGPINPLAINAGIVPTITGIGGPIDIGHIDAGISILPYLYDARIDGGLGHDKYSATDNVLVTNCEGPIWDLGNIYDDIMLKDLLGK